MLALGIDSRLCSTFTGTPQQPVERTMEFKRFGPAFLYVAPQLFLRAEELVKSCDIVHGHGLYVGPNQAFGQAARRQHKALVYHVHGMFEPYILQRSRWKKQLAHWLFESANFRHVSLWRALTPKEACQIRECGIQTPIVVAPNGLNLDDFVPPRASREASLQLPAKRKLRLLFLGRLHPKKGLDLLLAAWARLSRFHKQWELVVAGPDEHGYLGTLRALSGGSGIDSRVLFTGAVTGLTKVSLLHSADLFVLPSYSEGFSMSLLEAMACSVPVVATTACNFPEISEHQAGWECEPCLVSVSRALEHALQVDISGRAQRGRNGRRLIEKKYTWPPIIQQLIEACSAHCR
jgi:glycosyltransferase involved in cell wall biosynthesis